MEIKLKKRDAVWTFHLRMPDGSRKRLTTGLDTHTASEEEAMTEAKRRARVALGGAHVFVESKAVPTLATALERHWKAVWHSMKSASTLKFVVPALQQETIASLPITEVTTKKLREFVRELQSRKRPLAPATINRKLTCIATVLKVHEEDGDIAACPTIPYLREDNMRERYVTDEEEVLALECMAKLEADASADERPKWRLMSAAYLVLVDTGMRLGELVGLTDFNLRRSGQELAGVWLKHGATKNGKGRVIPLTPRAAAALQVWMEVRPTLAGTNVQQNWLIRRWLIVRGLIPALADVNLHILRHTCASRLVEGELGIYEVSIWLGHTDLKSTLRYAHLSPNRLSLGLKALEKWKANAGQNPFGSEEHIRHATSPLTKGI